MDGAADPGEFARRLRAFRETASLTQAELAERAGLTAKGIGALERGERRRPYAHTVRVLAEALGLDASQRAELAAAVRPPDDPAPPTPAAAPAAWPEVATPLLGRDRELAEVTAMLRAGTRLVTLTGPGGVGKTRLAMAAARAADVGPAPVLAELAPVRGVDLVLPTIARAAGMRRGGDDLPAALAGWLGDEPRLLVLDNLEHVLGVAPALSELIGRCPGLVVLATSRAPLRLRAEREYPVRPLPLPEATDAAAVEASAAGRMFLDRAAAVAPGFRLTEADAPDVAAICAALDGLPLALELAAAHLRLLTPGQLLARLDAALMSPRSRDLPERQRTMAATLDWSDALLTGQERTLLHRLSAFAGGFTLEAAEAVAGEDVDALAALGGLVEQSLVQTGEARYRMLEPVRQDAARRAAAEGVAEDAARRHADHVAALCRDARRGVEGPEQAAWLDRLQLEHGNLRAALGTMLRTGRAADAARLGADVWLYWALRGHVDEGLDWIRRALAAGPLPGTAEPAGRFALAALAYAAGDPVTARAEGERAVDLARERGAADVLPRAQVILGSAAVFQGDLAAAADPLAEAARDRPGSWTAVHALAAQAMASLQAGDADAADALLAEAEAGARSGCGPFSVATALNMRATVAMVRGEDDAAWARMVETTGLAARVGTLWTLVYTLPAMAALASRRGAAELAATLFGAGAATAEATSLAVVNVSARRAAEHELARLRESLGEDAFDAAWRHGRGLTADEVVTLVRSHGRG